MKINSTYNWIAGGVTLLALNACADIRNLPPKAQFNSMTISGGACTADLKVQEGSRGLFAIHGYKDYLEGSLRFSGQGFLTKKPLDKGIDAYDVIGLRPRGPVKASEKKDYSGIPYANVGAITVQLGEAAIEPKAVVKDDSASPAELVQEVAVIRAASLGGASDELALSPQKNGTYLSNSTKQLSLPLGSLAENAEPSEGQAVMAPSGDTKTIRSLVMSHLMLGEAQVAVATSIPAGVEPKGKSYNTPISGTIGTDLKIAIGGDSSAPEGASVVTVMIQEMVDPGKNPSWRALCTVADKPGTESYEIAVPTEWKSDKSSGALKEGKAEITVTRRRLAAIKVGGEDSLYVESGMGIRTSAEIAKKPEQPKP